MMTFYTLNTTAKEELILTYFDRMMVLLHGITNMVQEPYQLFRIMLTTIYTGKTISLQQDINRVSNKHSSFIELRDTRVITIRKQQQNFPKHGSITTNVLFVFALLASKEF